MKKTILLLTFVWVSILLHAQSKDIAFKVKGLCGMCQERVEKAALDAGAESANWNAATTLLKLTYNPQKATLLNIQKRIAEVGHDNSKFKAPDAVYNALPKCCQYRKETTANMVHPLRGKVVDFDGEPIPGAKVYWKGTNEAVSTDANGLFTINRLNGHALIVSNPGLKDDEVDIGNGRGFLTITMGYSYDLDEVKIVHRKKSSHFSFSTSIKTQTINNEELRRAACCNLSQSFETSPAVESSFTDAVTGTRQIEMLGLSGKYVNITNENIPDIRGLEVNDGLTYIPGTWIESIQLSKGTGSVVNGFEGLTGQMNIEMKKPERGEKLLANLYTNPTGVFEANLNGRHSLNKNWHTGLLLHARNQSHFMDKNNDSFADMPKGTNFFIGNRWFHIGKNGWRQNFGIRFVYRDIESGQLNTKLNPWLMKSTSKGYKAFAKIGKVFARPKTSLGIQISGSIYNQDETYGGRSYTGKQKSVYINSIFMSYINNTNHSYKTGLSFQFDEYNMDEYWGYAYNSGGAKGWRNHDYTEKVPGAFFEYTFMPGNKFSLVAGIRADYHNAYKFFVTPRLNVKYQPFDKTSFRFSAGKGYRTANLIAEYKNRVWATNHQIRSFLLYPKSDYKKMPFGLNQEEAWNYGFNFSQQFNLFGKESTLSADLYYTDFKERVITDYKALVSNNPNFDSAVIFHNLNGGESYSKSIQIQWDYDLLKNVELRLAYRYHDIKSTYKTKLEQDPFTSKHRLFANIYYSSKNNWGINFTLGWENGKKMPEIPKYLKTAYRRPNKGDSFFIGNLQISKVFKKRWDVYLGVENLFDYTQKNPIIAADRPWSSVFNAGHIWGPIRGREIYMGVRFIIQGKKK